MRRPADYSSQREWHRLFGSLPEDPAEIVETLKKGKKYQMTILMKGALLLSPDTTKVPIFFLSAFALATAERRCSKRSNIIFDGTGVTGYLISNSWELHPGRSWNSGK